MVDEKQNKTTFKLKEGRLIEIKHSKHNALNPAKPNSYLVLEVNTRPKVVKVMNLYSRVIAWIPRKQVLGQTKLFIAGGKDYETQNVKATHG